VSDEESDGGEDFGPFSDWLARGISDGMLGWIPTFNGPTVPDREPTGANPWLPRGPANVGGRVRAFVADPELAGGRPRALYAGAASGGVFRSLDQGLSWHSIWPNSMPTASIGALVAGADATHRYVYAATGERDKFPGDGVWRLTLALGASGPIAWEHIGSAAVMKGAGDLPRYLEAAAVDPDDPRIAWFVGPTGIYRFDGTAAAASRWSFLKIKAPPGSNRTAGGGSDVKFMHTTHGRYVVVVAADAAWGDLFLITKPADPAASIQASLDAATVTAAAARADLASPLRPPPPPPAPVPPVHWAKNGKLAIVPDAAGDRVYVAYGTARESPEPKEPLNALCLSTINHGGAPALPVWTSRTAWPKLHDLPTLAFPLKAQDQSTYNLAIAARPGAAGDVVVLGMVDLFVSSDGAANFTRSIEWTIYNTGRRGYHGDQHAVAFVADPGPTPPLWVGNDGGVTMSTAYLTAAGAPATPDHAGWRRRVAGLVNGQVYDLSQSRSLPDACGIALQDLGAWRSGGATSWRYVLYGDGLGMAFDPHDPYHFVGSTQVQCYDVRFQNALGMDHTFTAGRRALDLGVVPHRALVTGLVPGDEAAFEDTVLHPTTPGKILMIRKRRLYQSVDGESWRVVRIGDRFEILVRLTVPSIGGAPPAPPAGSSVMAGVMVGVGGTAAVKLGFMPGETSDVRGTPTQPGRDETYTVRVVSAQRDPVVGNGDRLDVTIDVATGDLVAPPGRFTTTISVAFPNPSYHWKDILARLGAAMAGTLGAVWRPFGAPAAPAAALPGGAAVAIYALPAFIQVPTSVELVTDDVGADIDLTVGGAGGGKLAQARAYRGEAGRPAVVPIQEGVVLAAADNATFAVHRTPPPPPPPPPPAAPPPPPPPVARGGTATYVPPGAVPAGNFFSDSRPLAMNIEAARDHAVPPSKFGVWPVQIDKWVRIRAGRGGGNPSVEATLGGSALPRLAKSQPAGPGLVFDLKPPGGKGTYDLSVPAPSRLTINAGPFVRNIDFAPGDFGGSLTAVTVEEVRRVIEAGLTTAPAPPPPPAPNDWVVEVQRDVKVSSTYEVAFSPVDPSVIWAGAINHILVSIDEGVTWTELLPPPLATSGDLRNYLFVEAIAPDPFPPADPANPVYTALVGVRGNGPASIFRCSTAPGVAPVALAGPVRPANYDGAGSPLRVYALEADPKRRHTYYAATEIGVFRTTNDGDAWDPFSIGLPHVPTLDLALDPGIDTLRVAVFGRGLYERYLGDGTPGFQDVYLRSSSRDAGRRPVVHGPDLEVDAPAFVDAVSSPDVRLTRLPTDTLDATEVDDVPHEVARSGVDYRLVVRANNRTGVAIDDARVTALWAPLDTLVTATTAELGTQLPTLPASFWTAAKAGPVAAGAAHGKWTAIGAVNVPSIEPGDARAVSLPWKPPAALDESDRIALLAIVTRGNGVIEERDSDISRLALHDARVGLRIADVRSPDDGFVTLRVIAPATGPVVGMELVSLVSSRVSGGPAPLPATALQFPAIPPAPAPAPLVVRSSAGQPTFDCTDLQLTINYAETLVRQQPTYSPPAAMPAAIVPAAIRSPTAGSRGYAIDFTTAGFNPINAVPVAQVRAFLATRLALLSHLVRVDDATVALALRRSPVDGGPRVGGASWQSGELVVTAAATAATDADFALLALARPADVQIGAAQRFTVRVWNRGDLDTTAPDTTVRFFWLDPHADTPVAQPLGGDVHVAVKAGQSEVAFVEATIPAISHDDVLVIAEVDHPLDHAPARTFNAWADVLRWATSGDKTLGRTLRRR